MTEFEMASLGVTYINLLDAVLMNYFTILSAYLVAGYAASHRLSMPVALFVSLLFLVGALFFLIRAAGTTGLILAFMEKQRGFAKAEGGLEWTFAAASNTGGGEAMAFALVGLMVAGVLGSVYFFFYMRRYNLRATP